jgi:hypothetical protein
VNPVTATLGGNPVSVLFAGLTPGLVGLIQFNIQLGAQLAGSPEVPEIRNVALPCYRTTADDYRRALSRNH